MLDNAIDNNGDDMVPDLAPLEQSLFYNFHDKSLLVLALTHESFSHEHEECRENNERLEFLGDSVLGCAVCLYLYKHFPQHNEGTMAKIKSHVASTHFLADKARAINLGKYLRLGKGEEATHGRMRSNVLGDAMEAVIGAIYLDGGFEPAQKFILSLLSQAMDAMEGAHCDYKSMLQEFVQHYFRDLPEYTVVEESGPPHDRHFAVEVRVQSQLVGRGEGSRKKDAGREAAQQAYEYLTKLFGFDLDDICRINDDGVRDVVECLAVKANAETAADDVVSSGANGVEMDSAQVIPEEEFVPSFMLPKV